MSHTNNTKTPATINRWGSFLRCYDNGGKTCDRYTIIPPRWARGELVTRGLFLAIGANERPFHPKGFGQTVTATPGPHLGKRVRWDTLPADVQTLARQTFPDYCPA